MGRKKSKKITSIITAICFFIVGAILILNSFGLGIPIFFKGWWTLFIIVPGILQLISARSGEHIGGLFLLVLGVGLLLQQLEFFTSAGTTWLFIGGGWLVLIAISIFYHGFSFKFVSYDGEDRNSEWRKDADVIDDDDDDF